MSRNESRRLDRALTWRSAAAGIVLAIMAGCGGPDEHAGDAVEQTAAAAQGGASAGDRGRPAAVAAEFVATPLGYFHPSCIHEVAEGETVLEDGSVSVGRGGARGIAKCSHPRYDPLGRRVDPADAAAPPPATSGWVAAVWSLTAGPLKTVGASWKVPAAPPNAGSQTLYFFPGLEPTSSGAFILQPVLAWNGFNDRRWTIASWNCCIAGNVWHSAPLPVNAGDAITGSITGNKCDARGVCRAWSVRTTGPRRATTLSTTSYGAVLDWAFAGAFEIYGVDTCDQLPASGGITFSSVAVRRTDGTSVTPAWTAEDNHLSACLTSVAADPAGTSASMTWTTQASF